MRFAQFAVGIVLLFTTFYLGFLYGNGTKTSMVQPTKFRPYSFLLLESGESNSQLATFTDKQLGFSFMYPKNYYMNYVPADSKHLQVSLFFSINNDALTISSIDQMVKCEIDNRRDPSGICGEASIGDFEVHIEKVSGLPLANNPNCVEDKISGKYEKTVFSCLTSTLGGNPEQTYAIYLKDSDGNYISMGINAPNLFGAKNAIKLIGSSFQPTN